MANIESPPLHDEDLKFPDHTQLPESDGTFVKNFLEHPQSILLTDSIKPLLDQRHPEGQYCIGQDCGIYWKMSTPPEKGAISPDWFYVPNVPPMLNGQYRRSYVLWHELIPPFIVIEFVSGDGKEERDQTPFMGKFWIYETIIRPAFYAIYEVSRSQVEVYHLVEEHYVKLKINARGHYPVKPLGVELGIWLGKYQNIEVPWLRWWDQDGQLLLTGEERGQIERQRAEMERQRAEIEYQRAERERQQAETERQRTERLREQLKALGIDPVA